MQKSIRALVLILGMIAVANIALTGCASQPESTVNLGGKSEMQTTNTSSEGSAGNNSNVSVPRVTSADLNPNLPAKQKAAMLRRKNLE